MEENFPFLDFRPNLKLQNLVELDWKKILAERLEARVLPQRPMQTPTAYPDFLLTMPHQHPLGPFRALPHLRDGLWCANRIRAIP